MGFVINNNLAANNSYRNLNATQTTLQVPGEAVHRPAHQPRRR